MANRPRTEPPGGLAGVLLGLWMALFIEGCILPQDEVVLPELPPTKDSPPRIVKAIEPEDQVATVRAGFGQPGCEDLPVAFSVAVADSDLTDKISHVWYVDRAQKFEALTGTSVDTRQEIRTVTSPGLLATRLRERADRQRHLVEVHVTDGLLGEFGKVSPGNGMDAAYLATYFWYVQVEPCP